jgi:hypothetical protein
MENKIDPVQEDLEKPSDQSSLPRASFEYQKYVPLIASIWTFSWLPSGIILFSYYRYFIFDNLEIYANFFPIFQKWEYVLYAFLAPLIFILVYLLRLFMVAFLSKISIAYCNYQCPMKELIAAKGIGVQEARDVNYYHLRGATLRLLKWTFAKCPFPWFIGWAFNFVGTTNIGKGTVLEDQFYTQEHLETGKDVYIGQGSIVSSHLVEGGYGAITLKKVIMGDKVTLSAFAAVSPGVLIEPYAELTPMSAVIKFQKVAGYSKYYGLPVSRLSWKRYCKTMQIPEDLVPVVYETKKLGKEAKKKKKAEEQSSKDSKN